MRVRTLWAVLVAALPVLVGAIAPAVHAGLEGTIPDATAYTTQRKLVRFDDGTLVLAYVVQVNGTNRVQVARSTDGRAWETLSPPGEGNLSADRPSLAVDSRGVLHLAWTETTASDRQVFYAAFAAGRWGYPERVSDTVGYSGFPSVALDSRDRVHIAWYGFDGTYYQVYYRVRNAEGWNPQVAVTAESLDATNPALALDGQDAVHIVWYRLNARETGFEVSYARIVAGTISVETISRTGEDALDPTLTIDTAGRVYVAWTSYSGGFQRIAFAARAEGMWSDAVAVSPAGLMASHPSLAVDPAGSLYLFYDAADGQVYFQQRSNDSWSPPQRISEASTSSYPSTRWSFYPSRGAARAASIDVVWTETAGGQSAVRFATFPAGVAASTAGQIGFRDLLFFAALGLVLAGLSWAGRRRRG